MTLIGVKWLREVAVSFFFFFLVFTLICGPPKIILPRAPQSVRPGLNKVFAGIMRQWVLWVT